MTVTEVKFKEYFNTIINSGNAVLIDFWAEWCGPCRFIAPEFEKLSDQYRDRGLEFCRLDIETVTDIDEQLGIKSIPTFMVFKDGKKLDEVVGASASPLQKMVQKYAS